ncbi:MAG: hypothetical protein PGN13_02400 [Patulibacter minatonensis]
MLTYALFVATDGHPVSTSPDATLEEVYDRARLSSGGTVVRVKASEVGGDDPEAYDTDVATFVNGHRFEVRDNGPDSFAFVADGKALGVARLTDGEWVLTHDPEPGLPERKGEPTAAVSADTHSRAEAEEHLGKFAEDWLT